jgi:hypothetical protein
MAVHGMIDIETLDVFPTATVLTLGAVKFNPIDDSEPHSELYLKILVDDQDRLGRTTSDSTIDWWSKQDPAIMEEAFSPDNRIPLADAMDQFHKFAWGCDAFWSHGATFDLVIIENIYRQLGKPLPWNFWQLRDTRTLFDLGVDPDMPKGSKHDALQDAIRQAVGVQNCYTKLKIRPR